MSKKIKLTQGKFAIVDDADFDWLSKWSWHVIKQVFKNRTMYYAVRGSKELGKRGKKIPVRMHRVIMSSPEERTVDHKNGNTLDNRRNNLRVCTRSENLRNSKKNKILAKSKYKGVICYTNKYKDSRYHGISARIYVNGKTIHLGIFKTEKIAAKAYDQAALKYFGEFACLNFPK